MGGTVVGVGTEKELGTLEEQVQGVELFGGERRGALLYFCKKTWYKEGRHTNNRECRILQYKLCNFDCSTDGSYLSQCLPPPL